MFDAVADYIKTRGDLDASRAAVYGWSMGGYLGTLGGLRNDFYKAIVNVGGPSDSSFGQAHCKVAPAWIVAPYTMFANMNPQTTSREAMCEYYEAFQLSRQLKKPTTVQLRKPILHGERRARGPRLQGRTRISCGAGFQRDATDIRG